VSSPSKRFECYWQPSRRLLEIYLCLQVLVLLTLFWVELALWARVAGLAMCGAHAAWVLPRQVLLSSPETFRGVRHDDEGWQARRADGDWLPVTLLPDSLALPWLVLLRFRLAGQHRVHSLCIPADALAYEAHRRLRVRLKFSRQRWRVAE